jgi:uracil-DNA glycosylase
MNNFCQGDLYNKIAKILENHLFNKNVNVNSLYDNMTEHFQNDFPPNNLLKSLSINDLNNFNEFLSIKEDLRNLGIDLPVYFGSHKESENKIMIVAMDPKRRGQDTKEITLNSVFSLHSKKYGRETKKQDYWKFIKPILKNNFVYLTDIYKLYYLTSKINKKGVKQPLTSNKDKKYTEITTHSDILKDEIFLIKPKLIVAYGGKAREACANILDIKLKNKITTDYVRDGYETIVKSFDNSKVFTTKFIAVPHPSKSNRQVAWDCFLCKNKLDEELSKIKGNEKVNGTVKIIQEMLEK